MADFWKKNSDYAICTLSEAEKETTTDLYIKIDRTTRSKSLVLVLMKWHKTVIVSQLLLQ